MSEEKKEEVGAATADAAPAASSTSGAPEAPGEPSEKKAKEPMSVSRRSLVIGVGSTAALLGLGALRYVGTTR